MPKEQSERFAREFNRRLGRRTGRPTRVAKSTSKKRPRVNDKRYSVARVRAGNLKLTGEPKAQFQKVFGDSAGAAKREASRQTASTVVSEIDKTAQRTANTKEALQGILGEKDDDGFIDGILNAVKRVAPFVSPAIALNNKLGGPSFGSSPMGRGLDLISRPAYGVAEGMQNVLEQGYQLDENGNPQGEGIEGFLRAFPDFGSGFASGFTGQEKTGFGEAVETFVRGSESVPGEKLRELEEEHPAIASWTKRGLGFGGEIFLDPLNLVTGGSMGIMRNTGKEVTEQVLKESAQEAAVRAVKETFHDIALRPANVPGSRGFLPGKQALETVASREAGDRAGKSILQVEGGAQRGKIKTGRENYVPAVAQGTAEAVRKQRLGNFEGMVQRFTARIAAGDHISPTTLKNMSNKEPLFAKFLDELQNLNRSPKLKSVEDILENYAVKLKGGADIFSTNIEKASQAVRNSLDPEIARIASSIADDISNSFYNTPTIRLAGKDLPLKFVGKAYDRVKGKTQAKIPSIDDTQKSLSYEAQFPGRLSIQTQRVKSAGVQQYDKFRRATLAMAKTVSRKDAIRIQYAIDDGIMLEGEVGAAQRWIMDQLDDMYTQELSMGARFESSARADNYSFVYNRKGSQTKRGEFKVNRKKNVQKFKDTTGYKTIDAKKAGLNPVENAFEALMYRKLKSTRDLTRAAFLQDIVDHYGFLSSKLSPKAMEHRGLTLVNENKLPRQYRARMKEGEAWYLPREHARIVKRYDDLSSWSSADMQQFFRIVNNFTSKYKTMVTVPFPGYHIRNMIGDFFMGWLDGVPPKVYNELISKVSKRKLGQSTSFTITPGISISFDKLWDLYKTHAASGGFYSTELGGRLGTRRVASKVRDLSELREDFGRLAHFLHALREEALAKRGKIGDTDTLLEKAMESAVYRVNHYKFDYGAITAAERKLKLLFPFYTFTRKAVPTLVEGLFLSPKNLSRVNRFMEYNDGSAAEGFNSLYVPQYMREIGYATVTDEKEPWMIGNDVSPVSAANALDFNSGEDFAESLLSMTTPGLNFLYEQAAQERVFNNQDPGGIADHLLELIAPLQSGKQAIDPNQSWMEKVLGNRLFTGLSTRKLTEEQQEFRYRELEDQFIDDPFREFNQSQDPSTGIHVFVSNRTGGFSYRVADSKGNLLFESQDPQSALTWAQGHAR